MSLLVVSNVTKSYIKSFGISVLAKRIFNIKDNSNKFTALENVSFTINKGEAFGIIGKNGAGKSTLLQIIAGTLQPTNGKVTINGRITALLELGSGFNPDFTGIENIYLAGSILGISSGEMNGKLEEILNFADIGEFIHQPVRTYSTGMLMRVAFSVAVACEPELLIIDEALSVGDIIFQQKCNNKIRHMLEKGIGLLVVTHDTAFVANICNRGLYLDEGRIKYIGDASGCVRAYLSTVSSKVESSSDDSKISFSKISDLLNLENALTVNHSEQIGGNQIRIISFWIQNEFKENTLNFYNSNTCFIFIKFKCAQLVRNASAGCEFRDRHGQIIFVTGLRVVNKTINTMLENEEILVKINIQLDLLAGSYTIDVGCGAVYNDCDIIHRVCSAAIINVSNNPNCNVIHGLVKLPHNIEIYKI